MAEKVATIPLQRRLIGSLVVLAGLALVLLGFFADVNGTSTGQIAIPATTLTRDQAIPVQLFGGSTPYEILRHAGDHHIVTGSLSERASDVALRGGVVLMALGALVAIVVLFTPLRGLVGLGCGVGLFGCALAAAVIIGRGNQVSSLTGGNFKLTVGAGILVVAVGFVGALAGGAVAAARPLAGLATGVGLTVLGVGAGAILAIGLGGSKLAGV